MANYKQWHGPELCGLNSANQYTWAFGYTTEFIDADAGIIQVELYMGNKHDNANNRYWTNAKWHFAAITGNLNSSNVQSFMSDYTGSESGLPQYDGTFNSMRKFHNFTIKLGENYIRNDSYWIEIGLSWLDGNTQYPQEFDAPRSNFTTPGYTLTVLYDVSSADKIYWNHIETTTAEAFKTEHQHTFTYNFTDAPGGLLDSNADHNYAYFTKRGYKIKTMPSYKDPNVQIGYWIFRDSHYQGGEYTHKIPWDYPYPGGNGITPFGLSSVYCELDNYDSTITVSLEWERDPEQMNHIAYVKVNGEWKEGILYTKTANGWKLVQNVCQKQSDGTWKGIID